MNRPKICASITNDDLEAIKRIETLVDLFEVRIDLIGNSWQELVKNLKKPWIACNRSVKEGGTWQGSESKRIEELLSAIEMGADKIDIELETENLAETIKVIKKRADCILSYHNLKKTPPQNKMRDIAQRQIMAGADICKIVTTAQKFADNLSVLQIIPDFPETRVVSFAMGIPGYASRILCPLFGGCFTYASIEEGKESAAGQITVRDLRKAYGMLKL